MKIERIYIAGHQFDFRFTRCCVASIRHWYPKIPITLIKDESNGAYSTEELETCWNVECFETPRKLLGFGFGKLEPLFHPVKERCLILDSDIVFVGRVLDSLENYDEDFIVADTPNRQEEQPLHYYDIGKLNELDPDFKNSDPTFNSGQFVATTGIFKRADFEPVINFSEPASLRYPEIFAPGEQGVLNYVLLKNFQQGKISLRRVLFMWWAGWLDEETVNIRNLGYSSPHPFLVHWAGPKTRDGSFDTIRNGHLLRHFESVYYARIRNAPLEKKMAPRPRIANVASDLLPSKQQKLLLQAALCSEAAALSAWEEWRAGVDLDAYLDDASFALLPLLYTNLSRHGVAHPWMHKLKGIYRRAWCENQVQFQDIEEVVYSFDRAGIPTLLLNGAALSLMHYQDNALRPIGDSGIVVPRAKAAQALALLTQSGWTATAESAVARMPLRRAVSFTNVMNRRVEISWDAWIESRSGADRFSGWHNAAPAFINSIPTHVFDSTETLAHVLLDSTDADGNSIADAMAVLNSGHATVDWPRLIEQARKRRLIGLLKTQVEFLHDDLYAPIPESVLKEVKSARLSHLERLGIERRSTGARRTAERAKDLGRQWLSQKVQTLDRGFRTHVLEQVLAKFTGVERLCARYAIGGRRDYSFSQDYVADRALLWMEHLNSLRGKQNLQMLELGSFEGRSALWFLQNILTHPSSTITCVDIFSHRIIELRFDHNLRIAGLSSRVTKIKGRSQEILPLLKPANFDIIYIDADHRAEEVAADATFSWPLLKKGGVVIFDDYLWEPQRPVEERPEIAVDNFLTRFAAEVEILHKGYEVIGRKLSEPH